VSAVQLDESLVATLIGIVDDPHGLSDALPINCSSLTARRAIVAGGYSTAA
jgi:hypothetical protein